MKKVWETVLLLTSVMVLAVLLAVVTYYLWRARQMDNVYPEIVGFCLEGIFFVLIIGYFQRRHIRKQADQAKVALKDTMSRFIRDFVWWMSMGSVQDRKSLTVTIKDETYMVSIQEQAEKALEVLNRGGKILAGVIEPVKRYGIKETPMFKCMLPVAAQIDQIHLKTWFNIVRALDGIVEAEQEDEVTRSSVHFLEEVVAFSRLP